MGFEDFVKSTSIMFLRYIEGKRFANGMLKFGSILIIAFASLFFLWMYNSSFLDRCRCYTAYINIFSMLPLYCHFICVFLIYIIALIGYHGVHNKIIYLDMFHNITKNLITFLILSKFVVVICLEVGYYHLRRHILSISEPDVILGEILPYFQCASPNMVYLNYKSACILGMRVAYLMDVIMFLIVTCMFEGLVLRHILWQSKLKRILEKEMAIEKNAGKTDDGKKDTILDMQQLNVKLA